MSGAVNGDWLTYGEHEKSSDGDRGFDYLTRSFLHCGRPFDCRLLLLLLQGVDHLQRRAEPVSFFIIFVIFLKWLSVWPKKMSTDCVLAHGDIWGKGHSSVQTGMTKTQIPTNYVWCFVGSIRRFQKRRQAGEKSGPTNLPAHTKTQNNSMAGRTRNTSSPLRALYLQVKKMKKMK